MRVTLLYLSSTEWGNLGRRKVRLAYELARLDGVASVLYANPPVATSVLDLARGRFAPSHLGPRRRPHAGALLGGAHRLDDKLWLHTGSIKTVPLTRHARLRQSATLSALNQRLYVAGLRRHLRRLPGDALVVWMNHPLHAPALDAFGERRLSCFDWTDDWLQFSVLPVADPTALAAATERAVAGADLVFAVSDLLLARARVLNPHNHLAPNATDAARFSAPAPLAPGPLAAELQSIPPPRLGYVGQIGDPFDCDLLRSVAHARPEWSLVLVGPVWHTRAAELSRLCALPNVHWLGERPYDELPALLRGFDVCLLPHVDSALTRSMDPTKLYDYLASGKPIASTRVAGTERFADVLHLADTPAGFLAAVERALAEDGSLAPRRLDYARQNTWQRRAEEMWAAVVRRLA